MATDEEKTKIAKLLQGLEIPDVKLPEKCSEIVKEFHEKFDKDIDEEERIREEHVEVYENPYKVDQSLIAETDRKLEELHSKSKKTKKSIIDTSITSADPKKPWRTNSSKEKLLRINNELKQHHEKANEQIKPLPVNDIKSLVEDCRQECTSVQQVSVDRLRDTVDEAIKCLPNFKYNVIKNSTAIEIVLDAHEKS